MTAVPWASVRECHMSAVTHPSATVRGPSLTMNGAPGVSAWAISSGAANPIAAGFGSAVDAVLASNQIAMLTSGAVGESSDPNTAVAKYSGPGGGELRPPSLAASHLIVAVPIGRATPEG